MRPSFAAVDGPLRRLWERDGSNVRSSGITLKTLGCNVRRYVLQDSSTGRSTVPSPSITRKVHKPIKFFRRRPVPPHPEPESQRGDILKSPTSHEWRLLCLVCRAAWDLTDPPSSQCTSPAHGHPRVVNEMASNLPSTIDLTQSLHMAGTDEGTGHACSARRTSDDRNV